MKIAIIGERERAGAWEKHLRKLSVIKEVIISRALFEDRHLDAVILLDESNQNLDTLLEAVKRGFHTYLVSRLPSDLKKIEQVYFSSQEANVKVQFSHWPSIARSTQWIKQHMERVDLIQIKKESIPVNFKIEEREFEHQWIDEIAFIIKWMGGNIHRIETKPMRIGGVYLGLSATLRFEDGSLASLQYSASANDDYHQRIFSNQLIVADCNVIKQKIKLNEINQQQRIVTRQKVFDPTESAEWSVIQFIKSIQMNQPTIFSPYDALLTSKAVAQIRSIISKN